MLFRKPNLSSAESPPELPQQLFDGPDGPTRRRMIDEHLWKRGVRDPRVLAALARVPRERFVDSAHAGHAYDDKPLDIGEGQTISQPYIVARMSELAAIEPGARVLEIGCGSGYQTAILMELGAFVYGIELRPALATLARMHLAALGYTRYEITCGDGHTGLPACAPFDAVVVAAAPLEIPPDLPAQLAPRGRLVIPVGPPDEQFLYLVTRESEDCADNTFRTERLFPVRFVPMTRFAGHFA